MRSKKIKRRKKCKINFTVFLFAIIFVAVLLILFLSKHKKNKVYYYDKKVFEKPKKIKNIQKEFRIPIVMYHYVEYVKDPGDTIRKSLNIVPFVLEKEFEELNKNNYRTLFVKEIPRIISGEMPYSSRSATLTFDDGYEDFYTDVFPLLKKYKIKATVYVVYNFIDRKGFLNEKEIQEIIDSGLVEIGAHTLDHYYLKQSSELVATKQIIDNKKMLENRFKIQIETFAYPYGAFDQDTIDMVKLAGYTTAVSVIPGIKHSKDDLFYLYRIRAGSFSYENMIKYFESSKI